MGYSTGHKTPPSPMTLPRWHTIQLSHAGLAAANRGEAVSGEVFTGRYFGPRYCAINRLGVAASSRGYLAVQRL